MIVLNAPGIALTLLPERGGKITSLLDVARQREWLESAAHPLEGPPGDVAFDVGDMCGWDEMMPTIEACRYPGRDVALPDHGELWRRAWAVTQRSESSVTTRVAGATLPYRFERTLTLGPESLRVEYRVSCDDDDICFLWAAHPLFRVRPGTRVVLDPSAYDFWPGVSESDRCSDGWPAAGVSVADDLAPGVSRKLFARSITETATATLRDLDGTFLTLRWRHDDGPFVGLWLDHGAYARHAVVAIEPTNGPSDALDVAYASGAAWSVSPGRPRHWTLELSLGQRRVEP